MKRIISILVAAALCAAGLVACGAPPLGDDSDDEHVAEAEQPWWSEEFLEGLETAVKNTRFVCLGSSSAGPAPRLIVWALSPDEAESKAIGVWAGSHYIFVHPDDAFCTSGSFDPAPNEDAPPGVFVPGLGTDLGGPVGPGYDDPVIEWFCYETEPIEGMMFHWMTVHAKKYTLIPGMSARDQYWNLHFQQHGTYPGHGGLLWDCERSLPPHDSPPFLP